MGSAVVPPAAFGVPPNALQVPHSRLRRGLGQFAGLALGRLLLVGYPGDGNCFLNCAGVAKWQTHRT